MVFKKQVSSYDGITPLCKYSSLNRKVRVSFIGPKAFMQGTFPKVETDSPEAPLPVKGGYLFWGSKVSEMG